MVTTAFALLPSAESLYAVKIITGMLLSKKSHLLLIRRTYVQTHITHLLILVNKCKHASA